MSTYEISKSSLLSLKAEILRKQQELSKVKVENEVKIKTLKKSPLEIKNKGVEARDINDQDVEEQDLLKQSKAVLEYKAELYERLSSGKLSEEDKKRNKLFLVRFDKKNTRKVNDLPPSDSESDKRRSESDEDDDYYQSGEEGDKDPGERWVDYVDCFGRTRKCLQKDLEFLQSKDQELKEVVEKKTKQADCTPQEREINENTGENVAEIVTETEENLDKSNSDQSELLSSDMRRELLRQQWEKEELEMLNKTEVHYQDVLYGEARSHGVGYYGFSKDEEERAKQQEALRKLRIETEEKQKKAQELKNSREKLLAARLKAARNRKRARMGLPPEEDVPEPVAPEPEVSEEELQKQKEQEEKERLLEESRKNHVRPWDMGKEGVKEVMTQEEWVDHKREERPAEFAPPPPSNYRTHFRAAEMVPQAEPAEGNQPFTFSTKKSPNAKKFKKNINARPVKHPAKVSWKFKSLFKNVKESQKSQCNKMEEIERTVQIPATVTLQERLYFDDTALQDSKKVTGHPYSPEDTFHQSYKSINTSNRGYSGVHCDDMLLQDYEIGLSSTNSKNPEIIFDDTLPQNSNRLASSSSSQNIDIDFDDTLLHNYKKFMNNSNNSSNLDFDDTLLEDYKKVMISSNNNSNLDFDDTLLQGYKKVMSHSNNSSNLYFDDARRQDYKKVRISSNNNSNLDFDDILQGYKKVMSNSNNEHSNADFNDALFQDYIKLIGSANNSSNLDFDDTLLHDYRKVLSSAGKNANAYIDGRLLQDSKNVMSISSGKLLKVDDTLLQDYKTVPSSSHSKNCEINVDDALLQGGKKVTSCSNIRYSNTNLNDTFDDTLRQDYKRIPSSSHSKNCEVNVDDTLLPGGKKIISGSNIRYSNTDFDDTLRQDYEKVPSGSHSKNCQVNVDDALLPSGKKVTSGSNIRYSNTNLNDTFDDTLRQDYEKIPSSSHCKNCEVNVDDAPLPGGTKVIRGSNIRYSNTNFDDTFDDTLRQDYRKVASGSNSKLTSSSIGKSCNLDVDDTLLDDYKEVLSSNVSEEARKRRGVEIAPPPTYDYYGPSQSKIKRMSAVKIPNIQDSIEAGLKFLRKQVEEKEKSTKHPDEMFIL